MKYFVYYSTNGDISDISPIEIRGNVAKPFIKIDKEAALHFISGKEKPSKWRVLNKKLVKRDAYVSFQYDATGFFNIKSQQSSDPVVIVTIQEQKITIRSEENKELVFYLTKKSNPSFIVDTLILDNIEKTFISPIKSFSIFADHNYGNIKWQRI
jgi:hypothetical protein